MGHFDGRLQESVDNAVSKAISKPNDSGVGFKTEGEFYKIFKKHDFFNVADPDNHLTEEQRAQVPIHAQYRYSNFANAIAEMFQFFFNDKDAGILQQLDDIVLKLDTSATCSKAKTDQLGQTMSIAGSATSAPGMPNPAMLAGAKIMQIREYLTGFAMGMNPLNPDMLPPIPSIGIPDMSIGIDGNLYKAGHFSPDWNFLYNHETKKSNKFYQTGSGGLKIGCNIDVALYDKEANLDKVFGVVSVIKKPGKIPIVTGNAVSGLQGKNYNIIKAAAELSRNPNVNALDIVKVKTPATKASPGKTGTPAVYYLNDGNANDDVTYDDIRDLRLNEEQIQASFFEHVGLTLWSPLKNRLHWSYGHWGVLSHNSLPAYIRTAICSYVWSTGLSLEPGKSTDAALISYLVTIGLYYYIGHQSPVRLMAVPEVDRAFVGKPPVLKGPKKGTGNTFDLSNALPPGDIIVSKLPKDENIAKLYWQWAADFIIRSTAETAGGELSYATRKRRVAEANLIYDGLGHPRYTFFSKGGNVVLDSYHMEEGLRDRRFHQLLNVLYKKDFYRYDNKGGAGGKGKNQELGPPEPIAVLTYGNGEKDRQRLENAGAIPGSVVKIIKHLLDKSFVKSANVSRVASTSEEQATAMYNNLNSGSDIIYGVAGKQIVKVYKDAKEALGLGWDVTNGKRIPDDHRKRVIGLMTQKCIAIGPEKVSKHCGPFNPIAVLDIGPNSVKFHPNVFKAVDGKSDREVGHGHLINTFYRAAQGTSDAPVLLSKFLFPHKFAVYALRTSTDDPAYHIEIEITTPFDTSENNAPPEVSFRFKTESFKTAQGRSAAFTLDTVKYADQANAEFKESIKDAKIDDLSNYEQS